MKAYVAEHAGRASLRGAFYATRPEKDRTVQWEALVPEWRHRADELGYDVGELSGVVGRGRDGKEFDVELLQSAIARRAWPDGTLARRDIVSAVATAHVGGGRVSQVEGEVDRLCAEVSAHDPGGSGAERFSAPALSGAVRACAGELTRRSDQLGLGRGDEEKPDRARNVGARTPDRPRRDRRSSDRGMER
jgi:hypothetical protein